MALKRQQRGVTLLVGLIMLVVLTLLVLSAVRSSNTNLRIAGNMQMQAEATASAQQVIEQVISSNFTANPASSVVTVDINTDGEADYRVEVAQPVCTGSIPLMNASLDMSNPDDAGCFSSSTSTNTGIIFASGAPATSGQSWCFSQQWDVEVQASSIKGTGAAAALHQGVSLHVPAGTACN
ncbi:MAG: hypothetical protein PHP85_12005 [Gallionella sp.]|nr:hypothetical protein [Gallionella sp.]